ncbi:MAG: guanylate kinase [Lachnospiraceae bacterium]|nr:guanylate kinase [Lachnospiraceae bacterium]MBP5414297.1 guanylate kinase [Lachnospiraceae bacterium]MBP5745149.1 guanylate kinase [Lachnospiraceae bacterium]
MKEKGLLTVVSGFSGAGKGTLMKGLLSKYDNYALSVSMTTRAPRPGEENGREYFFITREQFEKNIADGKLIEHAQYVGNYYGTPKDYVFEQLEAGKDVLLEIEIQGALQIKKKFPEALLLFVTTKDAQTLVNRLKGRGTEQEDVIIKRLKRAAEESEGIEEYEYLIVNDDLDTCIEDMNDIIQKAKLRADRNKEFIEKIRKELKNI